MEDRRECNCVTYGGLAGITLAFFAGYLTTRTFFAVKRAEAFDRFTKTVSEKYRAALFARHMGK